MASRVFLSLAWLIPRWVLWALLFLAALIDGLRHRSVAATAGRLFWLLVLCCFGFLFRDTFLLAFAAETQDGSWVNRATFDAYIFFSDLADSYWLFILLIIAAGYCITRHDYGPHKKVCIAIPLIYFISSLVVDYILFYSSGVEGFTESPSPYDPDAQPASDPTAKLSEDVAWLWLICGMVNIFTLLMAVMVIFDIIQKEREALGDISPVDVTAPSSTATPGLPVSSAGAGSGSEGHAALPRNQAAVLLEEGQNASHLYGDVHTGDLDAPKTVQEKVERREKLVLIRRFFFAFCFYCVTAFATLLIPAFVPVDINNLTSTQQALAKADHAMMIVLNAVLWLFMAALLWTFRMRPGNQYLILDEDAETGLGTALDEGGVMEMGILQHHVTQQQARKDEPAEPRFALDDEEYEDMEPTHGHGAGAAATQPSINTAAAQQGVLVEVLPSPSMPPPRT